MQKVNRVMLADSYKYTQPPMYPEGTSFMFDYMESRGGMYPATIIVGLQGMLKTYFSTPITAEEVKEAYEFAQEHGISFDYEGWMYVVNMLGGKLPVRIRMVKEGTLVPVLNAFCTIESTDKRVFWMASWMETVLMKNWYPINVATRSFFVKKMLKQYSDRTGSGFVDFQFHNFGDRGATCVEAANISGMAHLTQFKGTDNFHSLKFIKDNYGERNVGFSIWASEHSTVTSWGKDFEFDMISKYVGLAKHAKQGMMACVMDSFDIFESVKFITSGEMKQNIESEEYPIFVIRPDSGNAVEVVSSIINIMEENSVSFIVNDKGYKVWNKYRIIWGDGINEVTMDNILAELEARDYSSDNMAFGSGGWLVQQHDRDTQKMAIKCSSVTVNGEARDVFKDPITDHGKKSKKGVITLWKNKDGFFTAPRNRPWEDGDIEVLEDVWVNGEFKRTQTFSEIREISESYL